MGNDGKSLQKKRGTTLKKEIYVIGGGVSRLSLERKKIDGIMEVETIKNDDTWGIPIQGDLFKEVGKIEGHHYLKLRDIVYRGEE